MRAFTIGDHARSAELVVHRDCQRKPAPGEAAVVAAEKSAGEAIANASLRSELLEPLQMFVQESRPPTYKATMKASFQEMRNSSQKQRAIQAYIIHVEPFKYILGQ